MFDSIYGEKHWKFKCFFRSCISSIIFLSIIVSSLILNEGYNITNIEIVYETLPPALLIACVFNFIPDFISLLETRHMLRLLLISNSIFIFLLVIVADIILTGSCFIGFLTLLNSLRHGLNFYASWIELWNEEIITGKLFLLEIKRLSPFFYTTFFTSIWLWLYIFSALIVKLTYYVGYPIRVVQYLFDVDQHPILALGTVSCALVTFLFFGLAPFVLKWGG